MTTNPPQIVFNHIVAFEVSKEKLVVHTAQFHDRWMAAKPLPAMPSTDQAWDRAGSTIVVGTVVAK